MKFKEVIGQEALKKQLIQTINENRVSHAQLFAGPEGCGNLALALAYAQYICCENKTNDDSCGTCKSCQKYSKLIHPDLHFVFPVVNTKSIAKATSDDYLNEWRKALLENPYISLTQWIDTIASENKQGGIFEKESGEIIRKLSMKTYESDFKVMIIWMPEKMHTVAANKLLKMIEEPPAKTLFLLVSENPGQLLNTILSRTQFVKIPPVELTDMLNALSQKIPDKSRLLEIVRVAGGNYLKAQELVNSENEDLVFFEYFVKLMRTCFKRDVSELIKLSDELAGLGREKQKKFLTISLRLIRENFTMTASHNSIVYLNDKEFEFSEKFHQFINLNNIYKINEELNRAISHIEANGNSKIIFLDMSLKMIKLIKQS
jgi:DNA polymerase III subunit delta'